MIVYRYFPPRDIRKIDDITFENYNSLNRIYTVLQWYRIIIGCRNQFETLLTRKITFIHY